MIRFPSHALRNHEENVLKRHSAGLPKDCFQPKSGNLSRACNAPPPSLLLYPPLPPLPISPSSLPPPPIIPPPTDYSIPGAVIFLDGRDPRSSQMIGVYSFLAPKPISLLSDRYVNPIYNSHAHLFKSWKARLPPHDYVRGNPFGITRQQAWRRKGFGECPGVFPDFITRT